MNYGAGTLYYHATLLHVYVHIYNLNPYLGYVSNLLVQAHKRRTKPIRVRAVQFWSMAATLPHCHIACLRVLVDLNVGCYPYILSGNERADRICADLSVIVTPAVYCV